MSEPDAFAESSAIAPGVTVGPYLVLELLGAGGMGSVYRARDTRLGREVALKALHPRAMTDDSYRRFEREARLVAALSHPNIVALYDVSLSAPHYLVTELLVGETLHARLTKARLSTAEILSWSIQIAAGVGAAHENDIVHRDLKPPNIFVTRDGVVKLLDFGISRYGSQSSVRDASHERGEPLTQAGVVLGTPSYMAPEQVRTEAVDARADVFAIGVILYEMVVGRRLFLGRSPAETMVAVLNQEPDLDALRGDLPHGFREVVARCLRKRPSERYATATEVRFALEALTTTRGDLPATTMRFEPAPAPAAEDSRASIAVMAFTDLSEEHNLEYVCEGLLDEIMASLSSVEGLRVAARSSAARLKKLGLDAAESGRRLHVGSVLEGSVRAQGKRLRVTVQLTDTAEGTQVWAKRYDRELDDLFLIQEEIARAIVESLELRLAPDKSARMKARRAESPEAYALYLQGRNQLERRTKGLVHSAIRCFERAIALDGRYARAHAALAESYVMTASYGYRSGAELHGAATAAALTALSNEPELAESHAASAAVKMFMDFDLVGAELAWARACELAPRWGHAIASRALNMAHGAQVDRACALAEHALAVDADSAYICWLTSLPFTYARRHADAIAASDRALRIDETLFPVYWTRSWSLTALGRHDEAVAAARYAAEASGRLPVFVSTLGYALASAGHQVEARDVLAALLRMRASGDYVAPLFLAHIHAGLGDVPAACAELEAAYAERNGFIVSTAVTPLHDTLRHDARYQALLRHLRLVSPVGPRARR